MYSPAHYDIGYRVNYDIDIVNTYSDLIDNLFQPNRPASWLTHHSFAVRSPIDGWRYVSFRSILSFSCLSWIKSNLDVILRDVQYMCALKHWLMYSSKVGSCWSTLTKMVFAAMRCDAMTILAIWEYSEWFSPLLASPRLASPLSSPSLSSGRLPS